MYASCSSPVMTSAQRRRRDVLIALLTSAAVTLLVALITRSTALWAVQFGVEVPGLPKKS